jgi:hypothetical protein
MVDDWNAIASAPEQLREVIRLGNPEEQRYRPGFVLWNALQWHTLGAPTDFAGPQLWGIARLAVLVLGVTLLAAMLIAPPRRWQFPPDPRWILTLGVTLVVLTVPGTAVDVARFGPQEPLMVGCMSLGAVMLVRALDELLDERRATLATFLAVVGVAVWTFGVVQKESSLCVLVLAPFLWPTVRAQQSRWAQHPTGRRWAIAAIGVGVLLPFVPMLFRAAQLSTAETRVYEDIAAQYSPSERLVNQLEYASELLHTPLFTPLAAAAVTATVVALVRRGADWLAVGLIVTALAFVAFAAESGAVASRYYMPAIVLFAVALGRAVSSLGSRVAITTSVILLLVGSLNAVYARQWTGTWVVDERSQEEVIRESAGRRSAGCEVASTGSNVEFAVALPVLMPLAREAPRDCATGERFLVVIDSVYGPTPAEDPLLVACGPSAETVWSNRVGRILRCAA